MSKELNECRSEGLGKGLNAGECPVQVTVLGLGNLLRKDDGIGPRVVQELQKGGLPPGAEAVEAGGSPYLYRDVIARSRSVIVVDALQGGGTPGSIYLLTPSEINPEKEAGFFRHEEDFLDALALMAYLGVKPDVHIVGVEPKDLSYSLDLSPEIEEKLPFVVKVVRKLTAKACRNPLITRGQSRAAPP